VDEVFDEAALLETVQGDRELLGELGRLFIADAPSHIEAVRDAIGRNDAQALRFAAHAIRGSAGTLTARRVARVAQELERMSAGGDVTGADTRLQALEHAVAELRERLDSVDGY
jgi:HPt (histidine-containing phosphotransfer) domain-containing protein